MLFWHGGQRKGLPNMPETTRILKLFGNDVKVTDVPIMSATNENFADYELEDGSKLRVKFVASAFLRIDGEYTPDGRPVYLALSAPAVNVTSAPKQLLRPPQVTN
jgi:hypothetical protein